MAFTPSENPITNPTRENYTELRPFRFWCQKVLPLVYDDSLSYYELLCKVVDYLNKTMEDVDHMNTDMDTLYSNFQEFQEGTFRIYNELVDYVNTYFDKLDVQEEINNKLDDMVTSGELVTILQPSISTEISNWLAEHITPTSPIIDNTLLVSGAGADSKVCGDLFKFTKSNIWNYVDSINNQYLFMDDLNITGKFINPTNGSLIDSDRTTCGYIPLPSSGNYLTFQPPNFFGSNAKYIPLYDANKTFIKAIEGEINENGIVSFTITDNDFIKCCYIGLTHVLELNAPKLIKGNNYGNDTYTSPILNLKNSNAITYKGICDSNLNNVLESGYYLIPSNAEHLPDDYDGTVGLLIVFEPALVNGYAVQFLTSSASSTPTYHRYLKIDGSDIKNWTKNITTADNIFSYKGVCDANLNTVVKAGWYRLPQNATPLPQNYPSTVGILRVYQPSYVDNYVLQILTNVDKGTTTYHRYLNVDATDVKDWTMEINELNYNPTLHKIYAGLNKENLFMFSTNANYFNPDDATWHEGLYISGSVTGGLPYQYCYVPLQGSGVYYKSENSNTFGSNTLKFYLCNKDKNYITYKNCNRVSDNLVSVTLSDNDLSYACYTVIVRKVNEPDFYNRLLYNPVHTPSDNSSYNEIPNYGFISDLLYNKNLICTGDSIAHASSDLPQNREGWFGRLKTKYMMNGANYAVGGGSITYISSNRYCISRGIDAIHSDYPNIDYLILEGGTNDADLIGQFSGDTPPQNFGTWSATDFSGTYDDTTFCGAVESMFYKSVNYWPNAHIGFIVAMEMGSGNSSINRKRYFDEIIKIAEKWHIPVLNLWDNSGADSRLIVFYDPNKTKTENISLKKFYVDGQHPSSYGYNKMQTMIENWVRSL